jgi:hypothetical protein
MTEKSIIMLEEQLKAGLLNCDCDPPKQGRIVLGPERTPEIEESAAARIPEPKLAVRLWTAMCPDYGTPEGCSWIEETWAPAPPGLLRLSRDDPRRGDWECVKCGHTYPVTYEPGTCEIEGHPLVRAFNESGERTSIRQTAEEVEAAKK